MESSSWDGVAASLRRTNAHVESTFGAVVRENASLNAQRYAQDAAMAEMRQVGPHSSRQAQRPSCTA